MISLGKHEAPHPGWYKHEPTGMLYEYMIPRGSRLQGHCRKSLRQLFLCDKSMVLVLDDSPQMWCEAPHVPEKHVIPVHPYRFFQVMNAPYSARVPTLRRTEVVTSCLASSAGNKRGQRCARCWFSVAGERRS